eukprot:jgi/Tetstr1/421871/TSEL_012771.t1
MFCDLVDKGKAMDETTRKATASTLIPKIAEGEGHIPILEDIRVVTRRPVVAQAEGDTAAPKNLSVTTGNVIVRNHAAKMAAALLEDVGPDGIARALLGRAGRRCAITLMDGLHLEDAQRPVHQAWVHGPALRGLSSEAELWT